jgi:hypothetical protein
VLPLTAPEPHASGSPPFFRRLSERLTSLDDPAAPAENDGTERGIRGLVEARNDGGTHRDLGRASPFEWLQGMIVTGTKDRIRFVQSTSKSSVPGSGVGPRLPLGRELGYPLRVGPVRSDEISSRQRNRPNGGACAGGGAPVRPPSNRAPGTGAQGKTPREMSGVIDGWQSPN